MTLYCRGYEVDGGKLVIPLVRESDAGDYICTARNEYGSATGTIRLEIRGDWWLGSVQRFETDFVLALVY